MDQHFCRESESSICTEDYSKNYDIKVKKKKNEIILYNFKFTKFRLISIIQEIQKPFYHNKTISQL